MNTFAALTLVLCLAVTSFSTAVADDQAITSVEGDFTIKRFEYGDGNVGSLTQHFRTLGSPQMDADGNVTNAVLIMHGTTGSGAGFLRDNYAGVLFGPGELLDASRYFLILPDSIGHGQSSRPSVGEATRFPRYTYDDMVKAQYQLLTEHLGVNHLRLITGTSMGGMLSWVWGYTYPEFMDALMPLASLPVEIAGRNRMLRKMIIDAVTNDPDYNQGFYTDQPAGLREAMYPLIFMVSSPLQYQLQAPTRESSEAMLEEMVTRYSSRMDANDLIYAFDASRNYNPAPYLQDIQAPLLAINSADDQVNPPELGLLESHIGLLPDGEAVTLAISPTTRGHGTHSLPTVWGPYLARFMASTAGEQSAAERDYGSLREPESSVWQDAAPEQYIARFETTEGVFRISVERQLAPQGADRFYHLVKQGYYDGVHINRVVSSFIAQFGVHATPAVNTLWKTNMIVDDPVRASNIRGAVAFANTGPDTRATQVFINTGDNSRLDADGFAPFGEVLEGMEVVDHLYALYGEDAGGGLRGGMQGPLETGGSAYLNQNYPLLDFILKADVEQ